MTASLNKISLPLQFCITTWGKIVLPKTSNALTRPEFVSTAINTQGLSSGLLGRSYLSPVLTNRFLNYVTLLISRIWRWRNFKTETLALQVKVGRNMFDVLGLWPFGDKGFEASLKDSDVLKEPSVITSWNSFSNSPIFIHLFKDCRKKKVLKRYFFLPLPLI